MKKFFVSILAFFYLSTSMGATLHLHYCMGKLKSWGLVNHESGTCDYCGMPKDFPGKDGLSFNKNCCKDEHKEIKTDNDQKQAPGELQFLKFSPDSSDVHFLNLLAFQPSSVSFSHPSVHAPPRTEKQPVFLLNCNFRI